MVVPSPAPRAIRRRFIGVVGLAAAVALVFAARMILASAERRSASTAPVAGARGPWGQLQLTPIEIQPPEALETLHPAGLPRWYFAGQSRAQVLELMRAAGVPAGDLAGFERLDSWEHAPGGTTLRPALARVIALAPAARAQIHRAIARSPDDPRPQDAIPIALAALERRLAGSGLDAGTVALVNAVIVRAADWALLWDLDAVLASVPDQAVRSRLVRTLLTEDTFLVQVHVDASTDLAGVERYWGAAGAVEGLSPLRSMAKARGGHVALAALLPPFARDRIYRYPDQSSIVESRADCFWTALNFFRPQPQGYVGDPAFMLKTLGTRYRPIARGEAAAFGDLVVLLDGKGAAVHAAVHLAGDLVFTKNGQGVYRPWIVMNREAMVSLYRTLHGPLRVVVVRGLKPPPRI